MTLARNNFAVAGVGGYIAPRHLRAIRDTNQRLVAAVDRRDSVGVLDQYAFDVPFFTDVERFRGHLQALRSGPKEERVDFLSVCTPNDMHDAHCRLGLRAGADVICEKPIVIAPRDLYPLQELEAETGRRIYTVLQLRVHPVLMALRERLVRERSGRPHDVTVTYVASRGPWFDVSWKGTPSQSGGIATNIGVHIFDLLGWLFGPVEETRVHLHETRRMSGFIALAHARVRWMLSVNPGDLPFPVEPGKRATFRSIRVDGTEIDFTDGFADLHTRIYEQVICGNGLGIDEARPSIELSHRVRTSTISPVDDTAHAFLGGRA